MVDKKLLRNFPRYNIIHLKPKLIFPTLENCKFIVKDLSLAGLQVYSNTKVSLKSFNAVTLIIGNKEYSLNIHQVWIEEDFVMDETYKAILKEDGENLQYRSGFRLKFHDQKSFLAWKNFVHAFHMHFHSKK
ncbi:unnamed protein product [Chrysoparadoxa australica]